MSKRNRVSKSRKGLGLSPVVVALLLGMSLQAEAATYDYTVITKNKSANANGPVQAGSLTWQCSGGNTCRISGPWPVPGLGACKALAKMIGPIDSYGHPKKYLTSDQIDQCNKGLVTNENRGPVVGKIVAPTTGVSSTPPVASKDTSAPVSSLGSIAATSEPIKETIVTPLAANPPAVQIPLGDRGISRAELRRVAETINFAGSRRYNLVVFQRRGVAQKGTGLKVLRSESVDGLLLSRDGSVMDRIDRELYDDRMRNLVHFGFLDDRSKNRAHYSITATSWGESILATDSDRDGIVDLVLGDQRRNGQFWVMSGGKFKRLMQCLEEAGLAAGGADTFIAASVCVPCLDPAADPGAELTAEEVSCINRRQDRGGDGLASAFPAGAMQRLFGEPECGPERPMAGMATGSSVTTRRRGPFPTTQRITIIESNSATGTIRRRTAETTFYPNGSSLEVRTEERVGSTRVGDMTVESYEDGSGGRIIVQTNSEGQTKVFHENADEREQGGAMGQPRIGEDGSLAGSFEDPRCAGNKTSVAQGSIWGNQCRNPDGSHIGITECVRRMADSTYAITGGKCWEEPGPAGGTIPVCEGDRRSRSSGSGSGDDPSGGVSPGGDASDTTDGGRRSTGGAARGTGGRYIDLTPMGAFLIGLCAPVGCPGTPRTDR